MSRVTWKMISEWRLQQKKLQRRTSYLSQPNSSCANVQMCSLFTGEDASDGSAIELVVDSDAGKCKRHVYGSCRHATVSTSLIQFNFYIEKSFFSNTNQHSTFEMFIWNIFNRIRTCLLLFASKALVLFSMPCLHCKFESRQVRGLSGNLWSSVGTNHSDFV